MLDTGVLIAGDGPLADADVAVATASFIELASGVRATADTVQQAVREARLGRLAGNSALACFSTTPLLPMACSPGSCSLLDANRAPSAMDLMIAATAYANGAGILTRNPNDFVRLEPLVPI